MQFQTIFKALGLLAALFAGVLATSGGQASANPIMTVGCNTFGSKATFWREMIDPNTTSWWVDLSVADNGWLPGTYLSSGPLPAKSSLYPWEGLSLERYYFRIGQQTSNGVMYTGTTYMFQMESCAPPIASEPVALYPSFAWFGPLMPTYPSFVPGDYGRN